MNTEKMDIETIVSDILLERYIDTTPELYSLGYLKANPYLSFFIEKIKIVYLDDDVVNLKIGVPSASIKGDLFLNEDKLNVDNKQIIYFYSFIGTYIWEFLHKTCNTSEFQVSVYCESEKTHFFKEYGDSLRDLLP